MSGDPFDQAAPVPPEEEVDERPLPVRCAGLPLNDYGNGRRFALHFGEDLLHVPRVGWFVWTGQRWRHDLDVIDVRRMAQRVAATILEEIPHIEGDEDAKAALARASSARAELARMPAEVPPGSPEHAREEALRRDIAAAGWADKQLASARRERRSHARSSGNKTRIDALIGESVTELAVPLDRMDTEAVALNCESGTLRFDLTAPGGGASRVASVRLDPHRREDRLSKLMPVRYDERARSPAFDAFLAQVQPDLEVRGFIQRWLGLSLTAIPHQQLCFWYGGGANGKSVLIDLVARMAGDYAATAKIESLTGRNRRSGGDATPDLVPLIGARLVRASEPEEGERLQEGKIKELTGGEPILVRALNEDFVEVKPLFKLTISGNHKPDIRGADDGIWRRMLLVPWEVTIPPEERDPLLGERLWQEREGVFLWLVDGLIDFLEGGLRPPDKVMAATEEYRREQDPVGMFLTDACLFTGSPADTVRSADLIRRFNYWAIEAGIGQWKERTVALRLAGKAGSWRHPKSGQVMTSGKASVKQYVGVRMVDAFERRFQDAPKDARGSALAVAASLDD